MYEARSYLDRWILEEGKKKPYSPYRDDISSCISSMSHILSEKNFTHFQYCKIIKTDLWKKRLLNVKVDLVIDFYIKFY